VAPECPGGNQGEKNLLPLVSALALEATRMTQVVATGLEEPAANLQEVDNLSPSPGYEAGPPVGEAGTPWVGIEAGTHSQDQAFQTASSEVQILQLAAAASYFLGLAVPEQLEPLPL